jgi:hypothetical protein
MVLFSLAPYFPLSFFSSHSKLALPGNLQARKRRKRASKGHRAASWGLLVPRIEQFEWILGRRYRPADGLASQWASHRIRHGHWKAGPRPLPSLPTLTPLPPATSPLPPAPSSSPAQLQRYRPLPLRAQAPREVGHRRAPRGGEAQGRPGRRGRRRQRQPRRLPPRLGRPRARPPRRDLLAVRLRQEVKRRRVRRSVREGAEGAEVIG